MSDEQRVRIDVWLWRARFFKTRSLAAAAVSEGVFLERRAASRRIDKPATLIEPGDGLSFRLGRELRSVRVVGLGARRGPAAEARLLYVDSAASLDAPDAPLHPTSIRREDEET